MDNAGKLIMAYDGDSAGRLVGRAILADSPEQLHEVSARINLGHDMVRRWVQEHGGQVISGGGDEGTFFVPEGAVGNIEKLREDYQFATNLTMTVGIGKTLSEAGKSLLVGKFRGKNQAVMYDESIEQDIQAAKERLGSGTASQEEQKLGDAYLKTEDEAPMQNEEHDCEYCREMEGGGDAVDESHCQYCHDMEQAQGEPHCKYCAEMEQADHEHTGDDCKYCQETEQSAAAGDDQGVQQTDGPNVQERTTTSSDNLEGTDMQEPGIAKPDPASESPIGLGTSPAEVQSNGNQKLDEQAALQSVPQPLGQNVPQKALENPDQHSLEAMQAIAAEIAGPADGVDNAMGITAEDLVGGANMEGDASRPENFDNNVPGDMGLAEEEVPQDGPDLTEVLQGGLDQHADSLQREKVVQMVSQALEGFKASKDVIEQAKDQAPQLYGASIAMLKAMIEMAKMLGLGPDKAAQQEAMPGEQPQQAAPGDDNPGTGEVEDETDGHPDYENLFPQHPEQGGADPKPPGQLASQ